MREHAAGLLKHGKNVTWSKTGGGVRTIHHRTGLFFHMTTHCNGEAISRQAVTKGVIFVLFLSCDTPFSRYVRKCKILPKFEKCNNIRAEIFIY